MTILTLLILGLAVVAVALLIILLLILLERLVWRPRQNEALKFVRNNWDGWL